MHKQFSILSPLVIVSIFAVSVLFFSHNVQRIPNMDPHSLTAAVSGSGSGLIAHYTFDDGTAHDSSGNGKTGTVSGATQIAGKVGAGALYFDGVNDVVTIGGLTPDSGWSISLWVKAESNASILGGGTRFCSVTGGQSLVACTVDGDTSGGATSYTGIADGNWHHVAFSSTDSGQTIYIDGAVRGSGTETLNTVAAPLYIGTRQYSSTYFKGSVDDVRVYSRGIDSGDVQELLALGSGSTGNTGDEDTSNDNDNEPVVEDEDPDEPEVTPVDQEPVSNASGPNWYIDKDATGAGNGSSWTHAWTTFAAIDWTKIKPGHTIYISGGTNSKVYNDYLRVQTSGTQSAPITIRVGQDSGHNGKATINGINIPRPNNWITINGARNDNFNTPKNIDQVQSKNWTSNIGLKLVATGGSLIYMTGPNGIKASWIEMKHEGTCTATREDCLSAAVRANFTQGGAGKDNSFKYLWIHDLNLGDGFEWIGSSDATGFDNELAFSVIEWVGDNAFEGANGWSIHDNILGPSKWLAGHPDGIQSVGSWFKVYNNIFYDFGSSFMRMQAVSSNHHHIWIYNNIFLSGFHGVNDTNNVGELSNTPIEMAQYADGIGEVPLMEWSDIIFANNTLYQAPGSKVTGSGMFWGKRDERQPNAFVHNIVLTDSIVANNIFYEVHSGLGISWQPFKTAAPWGTRLHYASQSDVVFDNNTVAGTRIGSDGASPTGIGFFNSGFATGEAMAADPTMIYKNNTSVTPKFKNLSGWNFELAVDDTSALNRGKNLSSIFNYDILNRPRNVNGAWDRGAYEYQGTADVPDPDPLPESPTQGLVLNLDFEGDNFSNGIFADKSGNSNAADCQNNLPLGGNSKNQCPSPVAGAGSATAAKFIGSTCMMSSDYLAVQKKASLDNLSRGTISLWVSPEDYSYNNSKLLDTLTFNDPNTWLIGRDGSNFYSFTVNDDNGIARDVFSFPGGSSSQGPWSHYSITWDGSKIRGYYNGTLFSEVPMNGISKLALGHYLAVGALKHNSPRNTSDNNCINQYGDPEKVGSVSGTYVYPNAGFFTGKLDDIRIYNRALSASEISSLATGVTVPNQYVLGVSKTGAGSGSVVSNPGGVGCGKRCAEAYTAGTSITLTATEAEGSVFTGWSGACSGTAKTCTVNLSTHTYATANFERSGTVIVSFEAESATIAAPFVSNGSSVSQPVQTSSVAAGGKLSKTFTVSDAGDYIVIAKVNAPSNSNNSLYVNIDAEPTGDTMAWHMSTTAGFEERAVSWGGSTSGGNPTKSFTLTAGNHTLIIRGREALVGIDSVIILKKGTGTVIDTSTQNPTPDTTGPSLLSITASSISTSATTISWTTDEAATTQVQYGLTTSYGSASALSSTLKTSHSVSLTNLTPNTLYNYRVISKDAAGNMTISGNGTFSTAALPIAGGNTTPSNDSPSTSGGSADTTTSSGNSSANNSTYNRPPADVLTRNTVVTTPAFTFTRHLTIGSTGTDVKALQQALNSLGYTVSLTGAGSRGNETTYFGPATTRAIQKFQCAVIKVCAGSLGYGNFGPLTRAALNARGGTIQTTTIPTTTIPSSTTYTRNLTLGSTGLDVKSLQVFLNSKGFTVSTTGGGSPGNETLYFGPATRAALARYQAANQITPAVGYFGPVTRAKVMQ